MSERISTPPQESFPSMKVPRVVLVLERLEREGRQELPSDPPAAQTPRPVPLPERRGRFPAGPRVILID